MKFRHFGSLLSGHSQKNIFHKGAELTERFMTEIQLVSSDLNGTLVHQHTMTDMIRIAFPHEPERFEKAKDVFAQQTAGMLSMEKTFAIAGPLTRGLRLRIAAEYALSEMRFLDGFEDFIRMLRRKNIRFVINSTGYSITTEAVKARYGSKYFYDVICNRLIFGRQGKILEEKEISELVMKYVHGEKNDTIYDEISAVGTVELGIQNENEKARLLFNLSDRLNIPRTALVHIGDTMGDSGGISEVAAHGGIGIAFNYNHALKNYLENIIADARTAGRIIFIEPKSEHSDIRRISVALSSFLR